MVQILDYNGRPVEVSKLKEEAAAPTVSGVRSTWHEPVSTGMTPEALALVLSQVDEGNDNTAYLTLAYEMERRDLHYSSVLGTRKNAISGLEIMVEAVSDSAQDVKERDFVAEQMESDTMGTMPRDLLDALGKGYSAVEIMWDQSGPLWVPEKYVHRDARFFMFDRETRQELRLIDEADMAEGVPLAPYKFLEHRPNIVTGLPIQGGLARLVAVAYMCKGYGISDWMAFLEVFGMPLRVGKYGPEASAEQKAALLSAVSSIGTDAAAIISEDMIIEFVESAKAVGGERLFQGAVDWFDSQVSKGVLGQTMTTDDGSSQSQANVHNDVRSDIQKEDAKQLSMTLRRDLVRPLIDLNFGPRKSGEYPKLRIVVEEPEDLVALSKSLPLFIDRGLKVQASVILDKFGLPEAEDGAELLGGVAAVAPKDEPPEPDEDVEKELRRERTTAVVELMGKVRRGEEITGDQRAFLAVAMAADAKVVPDTGEDEIDRLAEVEVEEWQRLMDPVLDPVLALAKSAKNYAGFLKGLEGALANMDSTELAKRLAVSTFKTRGMGDGRDDI